MSSRRLVIFWSLIALAFAVLATVTVRTVQHVAYWRTLANARAALSAGRPKTEAVSDLERLGFFSGMNIVAPDQLTPAYHEPIPPAYAFEMHLPRGVPPPIWCPLPLTSTLQIVIVFDENDKLVAFHEGTFGNI